MLVATVTREGNPIKRVTVEFSIRKDSESSPVGEDDTIVDGSAAVRFPEGIPGGPKGELRIRAEIKGPSEMAGIWSEGTFPGGIPVPPCPWAPTSAGAILLISVTLLSGIASAVLFRRVVRVSK
jgi:hypothetical protein